MNARLKLNTAVVQGAIVVAAVIGGVTGSWTVFGIVAVILVGGAYYSGEIRTGPSKSGRSNSPSKTGGPRRRH